MRSPTLCLALAGSRLALGATWDGSRFAWYTADAGNDFASAVPIGNGRLGATVYGTAVEKVTLNENSMWSGPWQDRAQNSASTLAKFRQQLVSGDLSGAGTPSLNAMAAKPESPRAYQPLVDLSLDLGHKSGSMSSYTRWLDTYQGTAGVNYMYSGANHR